MILDIWCTFHALIGPIVEAGSRLLSLLPDLYCVCVSQTYSALHIPCLIQPSPSLVTVSIIDMSQVDLGIRPLLLLMSIST